MPAPIAPVLLLGAIAMLALSGGKDDKKSIGPGPGPGPSPGPSPDGSTPKPVCPSINCTPPKVGIASNPAYQWYYEVKDGDSASRIAARFFGTGNPDRWGELISRNPTTYRRADLGVFEPNRKLATVGTPGGGSYNWAPTTPIRPGDWLAIPLNWNPWIDEDGNARGQAVPFPKTPAGSYV